MTNRETFPSTYDGLLQLVARLRSPGGCPWDREQTRDSLKHLFLEECYELIEAIEQKDSQLLAEELGDVLFHLAFQIHIGKETGEFTSEWVIQSLIEKLVRRHPHIFGDAEVADARQVEDNWDALKRKEQTGADTSILDGVPKNMPALSYAQAIQGRASRSGLHWEDPQYALEEAAHGLEELGTARSPSEREKKLDDLMFSIVNAVRKLGVDAEGALRQANARFYRRYVTVEKLSLQRGLPFTDLTPDEKEALWQEAKEA